MKKKFENWVSVFPNRNKIKQWMAKSDDLWPEAKGQLAGEDLEDALEVSKKMNSKQIATTIHHQAKKPKSGREAVENKDKVISIIEAIYKEKIDADVLIKVTSLGLTINETLCVELTEQIMKEAKKKRVFVRFDMEEYLFNEKIISIYEKIVKTYKKRAGLTIFSSLYKSERDVQYLQKYRCNLCIKHGDFNENERIAIKSRAENHANFVKLVELQMLSGNPVTISTQDEMLLSYLEGYTKTQGADKKRYEFQLPYGIKKEKAKEWVAKGHRVRVCVPFGEGVEFEDDKNVMQKISEKAGRIRSFFKK